METATTRPAKPTIKRGSSENSLESLTMPEDLSTFKKRPEFYQRARYVGAYEYADVAVRAYHIDRSSSRILISRPKPQADINRQLLDETLEPDNTGPLPSNNGKLS